MDLGSKLRQARLDSGYTLEQAGPALHIHKTTIHRYETEELNIPLHRLYRLLSLYYSGKALPPEEPQADSAACESLQRRVMHYCSAASSHLNWWNLYRRLSICGKEFVHLMIAVQYHYEQAAFSDCPADHDPAPF